MSTAHPDYWHIKAAYLEHQLKIREAQAAIEASSAALKALLTAQALDPSANYQLDDATQSITPAAP